MATAEPYHSNSPNNGVTGHHKAKKEQDHRSKEKQRRQQMKEAVETMRQLLGLGQVEQSVVLQKTAVQLKTTQSLREELAKLEAENAKLREQLATAAPPIKPVSIFSAFFANAGIAMAIADMQCGILDMNNVFASMIRLNPKYKRTSKLSGLILTPSKQHDLIVEKVGCLMQGVPSVTILKEMYDMHGRVFRTATTLTLVMGDASRPPYIMSFVRKLD